MPIPSHGQLTTTAADAACGWTPRTCKVTVCDVLPWPWPCTATVTKAACWPASTDWSSAWGDCGSERKSHSYETVPAEPLVLIRPVTSTPHPFLVCWVIATAVTRNGS